LEYDVIWSEGSIYNIGFEKGVKPEIDTASSKIEIMENNGYSPVAYFVLPEHCWLDNYYRPMQDSFEAFLKRNGNREKAQAIVNAEKKEIALYEKYKAYYSYGVYIARKLG
jgi:hypothetical protein